MPDTDDVDTFEGLIRSLAARLSRPPIKRAELRLAVDDHEALAERFDPDQIRRSTHVYPGELDGNEPSYAIDAMRVVVNGVEFAIWQDSRKPTGTEIAALNAVELEHPAITMPTGGRQ